jgi:hypothetical protein
MTGVVAAADWLIALPTAGAAVAADEARPMPMTNKAARILVLGTERVHAYHSANLEKRRRVIFAQPNACLVAL